MSTGWPLSALHGPGLPSTLWAMGASVSLLMATTAAPPMMRAHGAGFAPLSIQSIARDIVTALLLLGKLDMPGEDRPRQGWTRLDLPGENIAITRPVGRTTRAIGIISSPSRTTRFSR